MVHKLRLLKSGIAVLVFAAAPLTSTARKCWVCGLRV